MHLGLAVPRTENQILLDNYLLLLTVQESEKHGWVRTTKVQKVAFYSEYIMNRGRLKAFGLLFRRHNFGPYSDDLENDLKNLTAFSYLTLDRGNIVMDELGERVLEDTRELLSKNRWVRKPIIESASKIAPMDTDETLNFIYSLPIKSRYGSRVEDVPDGATIVRPLDDADAEHIFHLNEDEAETLDVLFDSKTAIEMYAIADKSSRPPLMPFVVD